MNDEPIDESEGSILDKFFQGQADDNLRAKSWSPGDAGVSQEGLEMIVEERFAGASDGFLDLFGALSTYVDLSG